MTKSVIQPLESLRLIQYATPVSCFICGTDNTIDAEFCTHCAAPMALAHQVGKRKIRPQMIAVTGAANVGKTVYLGMLIDMLSRQPDRLQLLARGAFSITLQQTTIGALSRCEFPRKTPNEPDRWNWVHCEVRRPKQRKPMELIMPDMAGDAVLQEVDHPHTYRVIRAFLKRCTAAMILIDAPELKDDNRDQDYFTLKLLSYLGELGDGTSSAIWRNRPVALVLTKADQCEECLDDPAGFAEDHAPGLWQHCKERLARHRFFAAGVAGGCAAYDTFTEGRVRVPLRIEPRGIVEPFQWLLDQTASQADKR